MDSPLKVDTHIMMPEIPLIHFLAKADYAPGNLADEMGWRFIGNHWYFLSYRIRFELCLMGESFKPKKFCTAIHRTSVTFHFDWVVFFHNHPWAFGIFCRVFPIISPRLSPIPCAVRGRNKSYHPWLLVTDWGLWFSQKMLETKQFSEEKMNVVS